MVTLAAYVDDSGHPSESKVIVLSGLMGPESEWVSLSKRWLWHLKGSGLRNVPFHAATCNAGHGPFAGWTKEQKDNLVSKLVSAIAAQKGIVGITAAVVVKDYKDAARDPKLAKLFGHPVDLNFQLLLSSFANSAREDDRIALYFDSTEFNKRYLRLFDKLRGDQTFPHREKFVSLTFGRSPELIPIQAADLLAYESYKLMNRRIAGDHSVHRRAMRRLIQEMLLQGKYFDKDGLDVLIAQCRKDGKL